MEPQKQLYDLLLEKLPVYRRSILKAFKNNDRVEFHNHVHQLHGACSYCPAPELREALKKIEILIHHGATLSEIKPCLNNLDLQIKTILDSN